MSLKRGGEGRERHWCRNSKETCRVRGYAEIQGQAANSGEPATISPLKMCAWTWRRRLPPGRADWKRGRRQPSPMTGTPCDHRKNSARRALKGGLIGWPWTAWMCHCRWWACAEAGHWRNGKWIPGSDPEKWHHGPGRRFVTHPKEIVGELFWEFVEMVSPLGKEERHRYAPPIWVFILIFFAATGLVGYCIMDRLQRDSAAQFEQRRRAESARRDLAVARLAGRKMSASSTSAQLLRMRGPTTPGPPTAAAGAAMARPEEPRGRR